MCTKWMCPEQVPALLWARDCLCLCPAGSMLRDEIQTPMHTSGKAYRRKAFKGLHCLFFFFTLKTKNGNKRLQPTSLESTRISMKSPSRESRRPGAKRREGGRRGGLMTRWNGRAGGRGIGSLAGKLRQRQVPAESGRRCRRQARPGRGEARRYLCL